MHRVKKLKNTLWIKRTAIIAGVAAGVFILINTGLYFVHKNRTYSNTVVGSQKVGSVAYIDIARVSADKGVLPEKVNLSYGEKTVTKTAAELGVSLDRPALERQARASKSWLPIINVFKTQKVAVRTTIEDTKFNDSFTSLLPEYQKTAEDAKLTLENGVFGIKDPVDGQALDVSATKQAIKDALAKGSTSVNLPIEIQTPTATKVSLEEPLRSLQAQQNTSVTLTYNGKTRKATSQEVASWFAPEGASYALNTDKIRAFVQAVGLTYGIRVQNITDVTNAIKTSVSGNKTLETGLVAAPIARKAYNYCLATRGVDSSYLGGLNTKLASVFSDPRGWNLDGLVSLNKVDSGCTMTVWLSAASQMSSFGAICDSDWSCRVGANVVINFDRWQGASAAWNAAGGSLDDYRSMVINHETGHWFGFYHSDCGGAGQPAPVMQQQSISLQGCTFNPWPTASEKARLKANLGI